MEYHKSLNVGTDNVQANNADWDKEQSDQSTHFAIHVTSLIHKPKLVIPFVFSCQRKYWKYMYNTGVPIVKSLTRLNLVNDVANSLSTCQRGLVTKVWRIKINFNTFLILSPLFISASTPVTLVIGFSLHPIILLLQQQEAREKIMVRKIVITLGKI